MKINDTTVSAISFKLSSWRERADSAWENLTFCEDVDTEKDILHFLNDIKALITLRDKKFQECMTFSIFTNNNLIFSAEWDSEIHDMIINDEHIIKK